jgi:hypothetical protein
MQRHACTRRQLEYANGHSWVVMYVKVCDSTPARRDITVGQHSRGPLDMLQADWKGDARCLQTVNVQPACTRSMPGGLAVQLSSNLTHLLPLCRNRARSSLAEHALPYVIACSGHGLILVHGHMFC